MFVAFIFLCGSLATMFGVAYFKLSQWYVTGLMLASASMIAESYKKVTEVVLPIQERLFEGVEPLVLIPIAFMIIIGAFAIKHCNTKKEIQNGSQRKANTKST